jgi:hypothetical protein
MASDFKVTWYLADVVNVPSLKVKSYLFIYLFKKYIYFIYFQAAKYRDQEAGVVCRPVRTAGQDIGHLKLLMYLCSKEFIIYCKVDCLAYPEEIAKVHR